MLGTLSQSSPITTMSTYLKTLKEDAFDTLSFKQMEAVTVYLRTKRPNHQTKDMGLHLPWLHQCRIKSRAAHGVTDKKEAVREACHRAMSRL